VTATPETVRRFLDEHETLTLCCVDADGPWAADVYYVRVGSSLCFFSSPDSRHSRAFAADPRAAGTVHGRAEAVRDIRGVQADGRVESVEPPVEAARVAATYLARFPFAGPLLAGAAAALRGKVRLYRFVPGRLWFVDNGERFGTRTEVRI
jgi:hypothetical protein